MDRQDTFIQNPVQRTYRFVIALMLIACCCSPSNAQGPPSQNVYTIIGDVAAPNIYQWPLGEPVTLQMLLKQSKALGPSGKAIIRKADEPARAIPVSVWTNLENPIRLNPSDTVVWRCVNGSNLNNGSVALLTDRGTQLQPIPISGVDIGTLRQSARLRFDQPVLAYRNGWHDQRAFQMNSSSSVLHGDVLDVRTMRAPLQQAHSIRPQPGSQSVDRVVKTVSNLSQNQSNGLTVPPAPVYPQTAGSLSITMPAPLPTDANTLRIPNSTFSQTDDSGFAADSSADSEGVFTEVDSSNFVESNPALDSAATIDQLADEALNPAIDSQQSGTQSFLSGVFLFGLVLAVGLITIGIVRTRQEQRLHDQVRVGDQNRAYTRSDRQADVRTDTVTPESQTLEQTPADLSQLPAESITQLPAFSAEPAAVESRVDQLIDESDFSQRHNESEVIAATSETLKSESRSSLSTESNSELENCPVLSAGLYETDSSDHDDRLAETIPFADIAKDQESSIPTNQFADDSTESASMNLAAAEPVLDVAPWLEDDLNEEVENQATEEGAIQDAAEEEVLNEEVAVIQNIEAATDLVDQQSKTSVPENTIRAQLLKSVTNSLAQDANCEDLILDLPDVDSIRSSLEISESESCLAAAKLSDCQQSQSFDGLQAISESKVEEVVTEKSASMNADQVDSPQTIQDQEDIMAQPPMTQAEAQYLEDLIQNRLPMELSETQLPLKISLFGKPEGPRRLRIDAAHTTIAAPHMASTASRAKRREPAMAAKQVATEKHSETARASVQSESMGQSEATGQLETTTTESETQQSRATDSATTRQPQTASQNPTSGLDKALNFLEEQSKS